MIRQLIVAACAAGVLTACNSPETEQNLEQIGTATENLAAEAASAVSSAAVDVTTSDPNIYECARGTRLSVIYHLNKADVTILGATNRTVSLPKVDSDKGELYTAGDDRLHRDGDLATWGKDEACTRTAS